jgi:endonuclease YncB( thermonuclease family)
VSIRRIAFALLLAATTCETGEFAGQASVIDGDTIEIRGPRIRLYGIDAPEGAQLCYRDGAPRPCGRRAAFALADFIGSRRVSCQQRDRDRYGRIVAVCVTGGDDLSAWMA